MISQKLFYKIQKAKQQLKLKPSAAKPKTTFLASISLQTNSTVGAALAANNTYKI